MHRQAHAQTLAHTDFLTTTRQSSPETASPVSLLATLTVTTLESPGATSALQVCVQPVVLATQAPVMPIGRFRRYLSQASARNVNACMVGANRQPFRKAAGDMLPPKNQSLKLLPTKTEYFFCLLNPTPGVSPRVNKSTGLPSPYLSEVTLTLSLADVSCTLRETPCTMEVGASTSNSLETTTPSGRVTEPAGRWGATMATAAVHPPVEVGNRG